MSETKKPKSIADAIEAVAKKADVKIGAFYGMELRRLSANAERLVIASRAVAEAKEAYYSVERDDEEGRDDALFALANRIDEMAAIVERLESP